MAQQTFASGFQLSETTNPMVGAASRVELLQTVGQALLGLPDVFGPTGRPGNLVGEFATLSRPHCLKEMH